MQPILVELPQVDVSELVLVLQQNKHLEMLHLPIREIGPNGERNLVCHISNPFFTVEAWNKWRAFQIAEQELSEQWRSK